MNLKMVFRYLSYLVFALALFFLPSAGVALLYGETHALFALLAAAGISAALGLALWLPCRGAAGGVYAREGFVVAGIGWLLISILGALPFLLSGQIPSVVNALFESAAGFTTTGASVLPNVQAFSRGILFWRSFTHWLGGIGVLAFILALVRSRGGAGFALHLLRAEAPGPQVDKVLPKTRDSVRNLFLVYGGLSALNLVFLLAGGMPLFDALCTMFGTAGTGGAGIRADSMASYSHYIQTVTSVFMVLFGANFALYFLLLRRELKTVLKDEELRLYLGVILLSVLAVALSLASSGTFDIAESLHQSFFAVSSTITTTGYAAADFNAWPQFARTLLLLLMLCGSMAGSTTGGLKLARVLILWKSVRAAFFRLVHPRSVRAVKVSGKPLDEGVIDRTQFYFCVYMALMFILFLLLSADGQSLETNFTAVVSCFNNVGPGLAGAGPAFNYMGYSLFGKSVLILAMLLGRLEIFPILLLALPGTWSRKC